MAIDKSELETLYLATLWRRYQLLGFSPSVIARYIQDSGHHFDIDLNQYSPLQLIEFLQLASDSGFAPGTINLFHWAVTAFYLNLSALSQSKELLQFLSRIKKAAPPLSLTKPQVDLTPSFTFLRSIPSSTSTSLNLLSKKCAFLLAAAAFLHPSDLHHISLQDYSVDDNSCLHLMIVAPKETRQGRRINKDLVLLPLLDDGDLCPVEAFKALVAHPGRAASQSLFVNSRQPSQALAVTTLSTYVRSVLKHSPSASVDGSRPPRFAWWHQTRLYVMSSLLWVKIPIQVVFLCRQHSISSGSVSPMDYINCLELSDRQLFIQSEGLDKPELIEDPTLPPLAAMLNDQGS
ncbi:hypothetical protein INT45_002552 [Circinella minor]|uniref:Uncharacterized protein n=1 Tax=Circinella minor TaxID=1195481 RepID=A0A8H7VEN6_9FUNG|nr:hypothetical protein INT45_002552 [Circinella minor]